MTVLGLDLSVNKSGVALPDGATRTVKTTAGPADKWKRLHELEVGVTRLVRSHPPVARLVIVEGYALGSPGKRSLIASAEAGGVIRCALYALGVEESIEVPPSQLKRYATGSGGADKAAMIRAARAAGAVLTYPKADDEADAYLLRQIGRELLGLDPAPTDPSRRDVLEKLQEAHGTALRSLAQRGRPRRADLSGHSGTV